MLGLLTACGGSNNNDQNIAIEEPEVLPVVELYANQDVNEIRLSWHTTLEDMIGYQLEWSRDNDTLENSIEFSSDQTLFLHEGLEPSTIYYYRLTVLMDDGAMNTSSDILSVRTGDLIQAGQSDAAKW